MPSDLISVIIYVFLLVPGIIYTKQMERHRPQGKLSTFAETATVIVASSVSIVLTGTIAVLLCFFPAIQPWILSMITEPNLVRRENPLEYVTIIVIALLVAVSIGYVGGHPKLHRMLGEAGPRESELRNNSSAWNVAFEHKAKESVIVTAQLKNGDWIQGPLHHWNPNPDETQDRAFVLYGPIWFRSSEAETEEELLNENQMFVIAASEIAYLTVAKDPHDVFVNIAAAERGNTEPIETTRGGPRMWVHRASTRISNATKPSDSTS
ncbi:DUF6338 family protein [Glutamicibacter ardleyensis]|uniref:DUF6338 family protein n=1 Tax=Glutamicibacter ardleyensis TaxID=225894 RepID=UPI003FD1F95F